MSLLQFIRSPAPNVGNVRAIDVTGTSASTNIGADAAFQGKDEQVWRFYCDPGGGDIGIVFGATAPTADLSARSGNNRCIRIAAGTWFDFTLRSGQANNQYFAAITTTGTVALRYWPVSHAGNVAVNTP